MADKRDIVSDKTGNGRKSNIELMRIVAMLMIVGCHFATHGGFSFSTSEITVPQIWWHILEMGGCFGVNVFMMISGYFLITNTSLRIKKDKVIILWLQILFFSVLLFFVAFPLGYGDASLKTIVKSVLPVTYSAWWFASVYFVIYLLHPYINIALNHMDQKQYRYFLGLLLLIWSIIPSLTTSEFQSNRLIEMLIMYCIAGYIRRFGLLEKLNSMKWGGLWLLFSAITLLSSVVLLALGKKWPVLAAHSTYLYTNTSLLTIARTISFFMMYLKMKMPCRPLVNRISSAMFGVYLLHDSKLLRTYLWNDLFHNASYQNKLILIPYSIAVTIIVFAVCTLVDLIRTNVIESPIKRIIRR